MPTADSCPAECKASLDALLDGSKCKKGDTMPTGEESDMEIEYDAGVMSMLLTEFYPSCFAGEESYLPRTCAGALMSVFAGLDTSDENSDSTGGSVRGRSLLGAPLLQRFQHYQRALSENEDGSTFGPCKGVTSSTECSTACKEAINYLLDDSDTAVCQEGEETFGGMPEYNSDVYTAVLSQSLPSCFTEEDKAPKTCVGAAIQLGGSTCLEASRTGDACACTDEIEAMKSLCEDGDMIFPSDPTSNPPTPAVYYSSLVLHKAMVGSDEMSLNIPKCADQNYMPSTCLDANSMFAYSIAKRVEPCSGSVGLSNECSSECEGLLNLIGNECSNGDLSLINPGTGERSYYRAREFKSQAALLLPNCDIAGVGSGGSPEVRTLAPTMAPIRTVVESEVELSMSYDGWVKGGKRAFKKNIADACEVNPKDVQIKSVKKRGAGRRMLRILSEESLEVDFQVDVTVAIAEAESVALKPDVAKIEEALVTRVSDAVKSDDLKEDLKKATNEEITVTVKVEPRKETVVFVDDGVAAENAEELHDQPEDGVYDHYWNCATEGTDLTGCFHVYAPLAVFAVALLCMLSACFVKCCSKSERRKAAMKAHSKAQSNRSGREWEMPKFGGTRDSEFSDDTGGREDRSSSAFQATNPMANPAGAQALKNFRPGQKAQRPPAPPPQQEWKAEKTEDGQVFYVNQTTGESRWDKP